MSKIEWCDETWNPVIGCSKISEGCQNCYAEKMANRLRHMEKNRPPEKRFYTNVVGPAGWNGRTHLILERLNKPLKWRKPRKIFVSSMGDLFHDDVETWQLDRVFDRVLYDGISHHTWMLLTKRPKRMNKYFKSLDNMQSSFENVWLGVTVENPDNLWRIDELLKIPAAVRFISVEPMLAPISLSRWLHPQEEETVGITTIGDLNWVIAGPETGLKARPCKPEWIESLYEQCQAAGVKFFDKRKDYLAREFPERNG